MDTHEIINDYQSGMGIYDVCAKNDKRAWI